MTSRHFYNSGTKESCRKHRWENLSGFSFFAWKPSAEAEWKIYRSRGTKYGQKTKQIKQRKKEERLMAANVETMFYTREKPWHGLGTRVEEAPASADALRLAGLDWQVVQEPIFTDLGEMITGYKANVRDSDRKVLGVVSDRYRIVQNQEAFSFTDTLLGSGVRYETAGSLQDGRKVWLLARLPREYIISGERISPYLVFSNTHDGSGAVKVALTPVRVVCNNTLNLALQTAKRSWSMIHTGNISDKIQEAKDTLFMAENYMENLGKEFELLRKQKITDAQLNEYIEQLLPLDENATAVQNKNITRLRRDLTKRYYDAPDLQSTGFNAYRFINAVSDFATHADPLRRTANYNENLFARTIDGNPMIDKAYQLVKAA
jgi:phage/plasmid-like protein (TIGR03299 family)